MPNIGSANSASGTNTPTNPHSPQKSSLGQKASGVENTPASSASLNDGYLFRGKRNGQTYFLTKVDTSYFCRTLCFKVWPIFPGSEDTVTAEKPLLPSPPVTRSPATLGKRLEELDKAAPGSAFAKVIVKHACHGRSDSDEKSHKVFIVIKYEREGKPSSNFSEFHFSLKENTWTFLTSNRLNDDPFYANELIRAAYAKIAKDAGFFGKLPEKIVRDSIINLETIVILLSAQQNDPQDLQKRFLTRTDKGKSTARICQDFGLIVTGIEMKKHSHRYGASLRKIKEALNGLDENEKQSALKALEDNEKYAPRFFEKTNIDSDDSDDSYAITVTLTVAPDPEVW